MIRSLIFVVLTLSIFNAHAKKSNVVTSKFKHAEFSIQLKKKKLILSCKPLNRKQAASFKWVAECNNIAFNLLTQEKYQQILLEKEIEDNPFGSDSYQRARESTGSNMKKKSIRKVFKIKG